jgi:tetratricopeptide (TPR) repeat protein
VSQFYRAADLEPDMIKARFQIGQLYVYVNDLPRAKEQLAKMQRQDLRAIETRTLAVEVNLAEGNLDAGLQEIRAAIKENPAIDELYVILGNIYSRKGDFKGAESAYRKILDLEPKAHKARAALAR